LRGKALAKARVRVKGKLKRGQLTNRWKKGAESYAAELLIFREMAKPFGPRYNI
jgi:hypothetical protein